ncbi:MAG: TnpV protein [Oscillospiraceae bacterium]|nr:TnpV protein [Oscillospiraceae bacterium]
MNNISYHRSGDYYLPDLIAPESPKIDIWGYRRREYLRKYKNPIYTGLFLTGKLNAHLEDVDRQANEMFDRLIKEYAARDGVTEELKAKDQLAWIGAMNEIRETVEKVVYTELISQ